MKSHPRLIAAVCALALVALPATALAATAGPNYKPENPGNSAHEHPVKPNAPAGAKAKAYGRFCQAESKKHVPGMKGTPFSQCVTAAAKMANGTTTSPAKACAAESKEHVAGMKGTPFSVCVKAAKNVGAASA
ncbi:MAG: hypothetical protein JST31_06035 [Actinobacteria bacterium]|nr:hypothetical protein [Actinomycetota bacterium]